MTEFGTPVIHPFTLHDYSIIVHFKRLGSRHFVKEMNIQSILLKCNMIFRQTNLKPFLKYIQKVSNHPDYQT